MNEIMIKSAKTSLIQANKMLEIYQKSVQFWGEEMTRLENKQTVLKNELSVENGSEEIL